MFGWGLGSAGRFVLATFVLLGGPQVSAAPEAQEKNRSPYFVDGLHCEGLGDPGDLAGRFRDKAAAVIGTEILRQKQCEDVFAGFGLHKFEWRTPDDLSILAYAIKNSDRYSDFSLSLEKSQLQNHVHVYGKFSEFATTTRLTSAASYRAEGGRGKAGPRQTSEASLSVEIERQGLTNPPRGVLSFRGRTSLARDALTPDDLGLNQDDGSTMTARDLAALQKGDETYREINYRGIMQRSAQSYLFAQLGAVSERLSGDHQASSDAQAQVGYIFDYDDTDLFIGSTQTKWTLTVLYSTVEALAWENIPDNPTRTGRDVLFVGVAQQSTSNSLEFSWRYFRSLTRGQHAFGDGGAKWTFANLAGFDQSLAVAATAVQGSILPEQRFTLENEARIAPSYQVKHTWQAAGSQQALVFKWGAEQTRYYSHRPVTDQRDSNNVGGTALVLGLDYTLKSPTFDVLLGLAYASRRSR